MREEDYFKIKATPRVTVSNVFEGLRTQWSGDLDGIPVHVRVRLGARDRDTRDMRVRPRGMHWSACQNGVPRGGRSAKWLCSRARSRATAQFWNRKTT